MSVPLPIAVARSSTVEQVAAAIHQAIMRGELPPGTPLRETAVAEAACVSRSTVREALQLVVSEGLVVHHRHRGASVVMPTIDDVVDVYATRELLEVSALARWDSAAEQLRAGVGDAVRELARVARTRDWERLSDRDLAFHAALVGLHGSRRVDRFFATLRNEVQLYASMLYLGRQRREDPVAVAAEHAAIHDAVCAGDVPGAQERLRTLIRENRDWLCEILRGRVDA